ncbi:MAG: hypothetical protein ACR2PT_10405, partial [Endozoicomonas sp.]
AGVCSVQLQKNGSSRIEGINPSKKRKQVEVCSIKAKKKAELSKNAKIWSSWQEKLVEFQPIYLMEGH